MSLQDISSCLKISFKKEESKENKNNKIKQKKTNMLDCAGHCLKKTAKSLIAKTPFDRITVGDSYKMTPDASNSTFNEISHLPFDRIPLPEEAPEAKAATETNKLHAKTTVWRKTELEQRVNYDKKRFEKIKGTLSNLHLNKEPVNQIQSEYKDKLNIDYTNGYIGEVLSKTLAYLEKDAIDQQTIDIPIGDKLIQYTILHHEMAEMLPYYILKPQDTEPLAPSWVVIRGSEPNLFGKAAKPGNIESFFADTIDSKGIDNSVIDRELKKIQDGLKDLKGPIHIAGHSLGGEYAQHLGLRLAQPAEDKSTEEEKRAISVFSYNAPGVPEETKKLFDNNQADSNRKVDIIAFDKAGDVVPSAGKWLIGDHFRVNQGKALDPGLKHREVDLNKNHTLQRVDLKAENSKGSRRLAEGTRRHVGGVVAKAIQKLEDFSYGRWVGLHGSYGHARSKSSLNRNEDHRSLKEQLELIKNKEKEKKFVSNINKINRIAYEGDKKISEMLKKVSESRSVVRISPNEKHKKLLEFLENRIDKAEKAIQNDKVQKKKITADIKALKDEIPGVKQGLDTLSDQKKLKNLNKKLNQNRKRLEGLKKERGLLTVSEFNEKKDNINKTIVNLNYQIFKLEERITLRFEDADYTTMTTMRKVIDRSDQPNSKLYELLYEDLSQNHRKKILLSINNSAKKTAKEQPELFENERFRLAFCDVDDTIKDSILNDGNTQARDENGLYPGSISFGKAIMKSAEGSPQPGRLVFLSARPVQLKSISNRQMKKTLPEDIPFQALYGSFKGIAHGITHYTVGKGMQKIGQKKRAQDIEKTTMDRFAAEKRLKTDRFLLLYPEAIPMMVGDSGEGDLAFIVEKNNPDKAATNRLEDQLIPQQLRNRGDGDESPIHYANDPLSVSFVHKVLGKKEYHSTPDPSTIQNEKIIIFGNYVDAALKAYTMKKIDKESLDNIVKETQEWLKNDPLYKKMKPLEDQDVSQTHTTNAQRYRLNLQKSINEALAMKSSA